MVNFTSILLSLMFLAAISQAKSVHHQLVKRQTAISNFPLGSSMRQFHENLYQVLGENENGNLVYSPYSIHTAMTMVLIGTPGNSTTYTELAKALGITESTVIGLNYKNLYDTYKNLDKNIQIELAYKAYVDEGFVIKPTYQDYLKQFFKADLEALEFNNAQKAANEINEFVSEATKGLITEIANPSSFDPLTRMVLVNAIYFKGVWAQKFDQAKTEPMEFTVETGKTITYPHGMNMKAKLGLTKIKGQKGEDMTVVALPYTNPNFEMLLILPKGHIRNIDINDLDLVNINKRLFEQQVMITVPKFKMEFKTSLRDTLKDLGVEDLFDERNADLSDISDEELYVSEVNHKAVIEVNEKGSEAAAVTVVQIETRVTNLGVEKVVFDRPFLFVIYDIQNKIPLFFGRMVDPSGTYELEQPKTASKAVTASEAQLKEHPKDCHNIEDQVNSTKIIFPCKDEDLAEILEESFQ